MSLHQLAQHMQSAGRGEDSVLIHMTPGEVNGLQSLAEKHGGSLTINPKTGLPEAGFLSSLLPMALGLGLAPFTGGMSAAMLVGGGYTLATGSLKKGLMAGLGAYGGAGLGSSLSALGAGAAPASALGGTSPLAGVGVENFAAPTAFGNAGTAGATTAGTAAQTGGLSGLQPFANPDIMAANPYGMSAGMPVPGSVNFTPPYIAEAPIGEVVGMPQVSANPSAVNTPTSGGFRSSMNTAPTQLTAARQALQIPASIPTTYASMGEGLSKLNSLDALKTFGGDNMMNIGAAVAPMMVPDKFTPPKQNQGMIRPYTMDRTQNPQAYAQDAQGRTNIPVYGQPFDSSERQYFTDKYTAGTPYAAPGPEYKATGGLTALAIGGSVGGPVEDMAAQNSMSQNTGYPMANLQSSMYTNSQMQRPMSENVVNASGDVGVDPYTGEQKFAAGGGISDLGGYSDGGRLLRGPGDGVSDSIPASIGDNQPARLADGEFVVPARIVSELGNGSTEAGARQLYKMMERVQHNRRKSVGKGRVAVDAKSAKFLPA